MKTENMGVQSKEMLVSIQMNIPSPLFHKPNAWVFALLHPHWPTHQNTCDDDPSELLTTQGYTRGLSLVMHTRQQSQAHACTWRSTELLHEVANEDKGQLEETSLAPKRSPTYAFASKCRCICM